MADEGRVELGLRREERGERREERGEDHQDMSFFGDKEEGEDAYDVGSWGFNVQIPRKSSLILSGSMDRQEEKRKKKKRNREGRGRKLAFI